MKNKIKLKRIVMLLAVLLVLLVPYSAFAAQTTLTTTVPSEFPVKIEIEGWGSVIVDDAEYTESTDITVKRNENIKYIFVSADGYEIKSVYYNGKDVTEKLKENSLSVFSDNDAELKVCFSVIPEKPKTGDSSNIYGAILLAVLSLSIMVITILVTKKKKQL